MSCDAVMGEARRELSGECDSEEEAEEGKAREGKGMERGARRSV